MAKTSKENKKIKSQGFLISKVSSLHSMVKDVGSQKANITIDNWQQWCRQLEGN
jgi:hypothetical protein